MSNRRLSELEQHLRTLGMVAVAYSGGVDSTFLLAAAARALDQGNVIALTAQSPLTPPWEVEFAAQFCRETGVAHETLDASFVLRDERIVANSRRRCYFCKKRLLHVMKEHAPQGSTLLTGTNASDEGEYRPGMEAEEELGVASPLRTLRFTKDMIRHYSRILGISGGDRPSATCFATRIPYGEPVTREKVMMIRAGETFLRDAGFSVVRVRLVGGGTARIEVAPEMVGRIIARQEELGSEFARLGFDRVTIDAEGYRSGKFDAVSS